MNNRGEIKCVGVRDWRGRERVLATTSRDKDGRTYVHPCDSSEPIGPRWDWTDMLPDLCRRVCGKCSSRRDVGEDK